MRWIPPVCLALLLPATTLAQAPALEIAGGVQRPGAHSIADLSGLPADTATGGGRAEDVGLYRGIALWSLLQHVGIAVDSTRRGDLMRKVVVAQGADGYQAVFSLGELHPDYGNSRVLVAWERNGEALAPDRGPFRLVVPDDRRHSRNVYRLVRLRVADAGL
jgi:DMSO/TMAO reductase YedYZ molybdopterin-dependent catalytic subunit